MPLSAPAHLSKRSLHPAVLQEHLQSHAVARQRSLVSRQSGNLTQSSTNPEDKIQSLAYLSGAYTAPLNLSSNPTQLVYVQLDTGSADLWITSTNCHTAECNRKGLLKFDPAQSKTLTQIQVAAGSSLNVTSSSIAGNATDGSSLPADAGNVGIAKRQSGDGNKEDVPFYIFYSDTTSASGTLAAENMSISDLDVAQQAFALINATNVTLSAQGISGVLGLGFPRGSVISRSLVGYQDQLADVKTLPFMTSLLQGSNESYPLFGLYLTTEGGRATFGAVDPLVLPTDADRELVEWYDVYPFPAGNTALPSNSSHNVDGEALGPYVQWVLPLTAAGVAGESASLTTTYRQVGTDPLALLDSGTAAILGPAADVESIFSQITNSRYVGGGRFVIPCATTSRMYFSFGGRNITLLPSDYIIGPDLEQPDLCFAWPSASPSDATGVDWVLGTPFLRATYSLFSIGINDKEAPKIGLYPLRQPANATASSVVFAPEPTQNLSSFLAQATKYNSVLPNSLVSLEASSTPAYVFQNATTTASRGVLPTRVGAPSTYSAILPTGLVGQAVGRLPVIASSSTPIPLPSNPAEDGSGAGGGGGGGAHNAATKWMPLDAQWLPLVPALALGCVALPWWMM